MTRRVLLHVGTPKTGTSYLQDVLFRNQARLRGRGVLYPADRFDAHFLAALDLMRLPWGGLETEALGRWDALAAEVRAHPGTSIISHEILARATPAQAHRALTSFDEPPSRRRRRGGAEEPTEPVEPAEVHLLLSVRDLVRQVPAEWQENIKHRSSLSYDRFLAQVADPERSSRIGSWFWAVQEIPDILHRWGSSLPPERVHVITVPPSGGAPGELWSRFSTAFDLDGQRLNLDASRANPSLGAPETALLRRINKQLVGVVPPDHYRRLVRELLAHRTLSGRADSPRLGLPTHLHSWVQELQESWVEEITQRGYHVVGDLKDMLATPAAAPTDPDSPEEAQVADAALSAITALIGEQVGTADEVARLRGVEHVLHRQLDEVRDELARSYLRPSFRIRERTVRRLEGSRAGRVAMRGYRGLRPRNSRLA